MSTKKNVSKLAQSAIWRQNTIAGYNLEWDMRGDARAGLRHLAQARLAGVVIGIGQPLAAALGVAVPGLRAFAAIEDGPGFPATQRALWAYITAATPGTAFDAADSLTRLLRAEFTLVESTALFRYRDGRDLTGYVDGTANPKKREQPRVVLLPTGPFAGGSFALVQRFVHERARFQALARADQDNVIGRSLVGNRELAHAPPSAHIKRTEQEDYDPPAFMLRRSMPWGDPRRHGLQFIAFMAELDRAERMLRRMAGQEDGIVDALMGFTHAETGAFYFCPPVKKGRLQLEPWLASIR